MKPSPGNFSDLLPVPPDTEVAPAVAAACAAFDDWRREPLEARLQRLDACAHALRDARSRLATLMAREVGKPVHEALLEVDAAIAKIGFTAADAREFAGRTVADGPHPASVRLRPRGPAAVIAPFNFPIHLGHGAAVAYLLAGNPVLFKPSPLAANTGAAYGEVMAPHFPRGVFQIVQGGAETGRALALDPRVRSVCFTGSAAAGFALANALAGDYSKSLALELGGSNVSIVCGDADPGLAAAAIAESIALTTGQRCNATSRILVQSGLMDTFLRALSSALSAFEPGDPLLEKTRLGPLASRPAFDRYRRLTSHPGRWVVPPWSDDARGFYVKPAVLVADLSAEQAGPLGDEEFFAPVAVVESFGHPAEAVARQSRDEFGLTASVFTSCEETFSLFADELQVGNLYRNLPTTFSPSTLPFGGALRAGNGHPGGRGFIRFCGFEQSLQIRK